MDIDVVQLASEVFSKISRYLPHEKASAIFNDIAEIFGMAQARIAEAQLKYASATKKMRHESQLQQSKEDLYKHKLEEAKSALQAAKAENLRIIREREKDLEEKAKALEKHWRNLLVEAEKRLHKKKEAEYQKMLQSQELLWKAETQKQVSEAQQCLEEHYEQELVTATQGANQELAEMAELVCTMQKRVEDMEAEQRQLIRQRQLMEEEVKRLRERSRVLEVWADDGQRRAREAENEAAVVMEKLSNFEAQNHEREDHNWFQSNVLGTTPIVTAQSYSPTTEKYRRRSNPANVTDSSLRSQQQSSIRFPSEYPSSIPFIEKDSFATRSPRSSLKDRNFGENQKKETSYSRSLNSGLAHSSDQHHPRLDELLENIL
mmetsp:Transcript_36420/g.46379  ORF Transcript_36420/g.46379 Transcript_36420/m.46379 type:complete len:376 (-) Transcript_36420:37-1164(-)